MSRFINRNLKSKNTIIIKIDKQTKELDDEPQVNTSRAICFKS